MTVRSRLVESWELSGGRWWWLYVALGVVVWIGVVVVPEGSWWWGAIFAFSSVEIGFRAVERVRRRRVQARV